MRIRFRAESGGDGFDYYGDLLIDNVSMRETLLNCLDVTSLAASATSSSSIEVSFVDVNATTLLLTATLVTYDDGNGARTVSPNPTASPFTISGLTANTTYTITVQADCGTAQTNAVSTVAATDCDAVSSFPWLEDFETTSTTIDCWTSLYNVWTSNWSNQWKCKWIVGDYSGRSFVLWHGTYLHHDSSSACDRLFSLTSLTSPELTFQHASVIGVVMDEFDVFFTTTGTDNLSTFTNVIAS